MFLPGMFLIGFKFLMVPINVGITRLVYSVAYRGDEKAVNFLKGAGIEVVRNGFIPPPGTPGGGGELTGAAA